MEGPVQNELERALDVAHRAIAARERTTFELRTYLEGKRVEPEAIEAVIQQLADGGLLDDADYARRFAEDRRTLRRWGRERIERELHRRGVSSQLIDTALCDHERSEELETAVELLGERAAALDDDRARDRAWRLLVRRGYEPELAYEAVRAHARRAA